HAGLEDPALLEALRREGDAEAAPPLARVRERQPLVDQPDGGPPAAGARTSGRRRRAPRVRPTGPSRPRRSTAEPPFYSRTTLPLASLYTAFFTVSFPASTAFARIGLFASTSWALCSTFASTASWSN